MFSYNAFTSEASNGWKSGIGDNMILLIQDPQGRPFATAQQGIVSDMVLESKQAIDNIWGYLSAEINKLDKFVIYVGSYGAEYAIELAQKSNIPVEKLMFVFCDCGLGKKRATLQRCGYSDAKVIDCECGGKDTMGQIYRKFLQTGQLDMAA